MDKRTPKEFVDFLQGAVLNEWGYVWGGRGKSYNEAERDYLYKTYHTAKYDWTYYYATQWKRWEGHRVCDCSGLIEAFSGLNRTAQGFYASSVGKGTMSSFANTAGYLVFRYSGGRMVHVGAFIGNGTVVESRDSATGVVKTKLAAGKWTHWGKPDFIDFTKAAPAPSPPPKLTLGRELRLTKPLMKGDDVKAVQRALRSDGFNVGKSGIDGVYGPDTRAAARRFQQANKLLVDGIVGRKTTAALGGKWTG